MESNHNHHASLITTRRVWNRTTISTTFLINTPPTPILTKLGRNRTFSSWLSHPRDTSNPAPLSSQSGCANKRKRKRSSCRVLWRHRLTESLPEFFSLINQLAAKANLSSLSASSKQGGIDNREPNRALAKARSLFPLSIVDTNAESNRQLFLLETSHLLK